MKSPTPNYLALKIATTFQEIKSKGGHAAIDYKDGEIVLHCATPTDNMENWGFGEVPAKWSDDWVRLVEC
jgi:hypothetical protein